MAAPDMRIPIQYALMDGERALNKFQLISLPEAGPLTFEEPDTEKFPCLELAFAAGKKGGTMTAVLNAANNEAVRLFIEKKIKFTDIPVLVKQAMDKHFNTSDPTLDDILSADLWAKKEIITGLA
jgi:1-deoxy-D-xylulose-5-phosphate reductoisomerase